MSQYIVTLDPCAHSRTSRGKNIPLVHGSWRSEVCLDCGAFRARDHHDKIITGHQGGWRLAEYYADATGGHDE